MNDHYIIGMFVCLGIAIIINYYNINKHLKEHVFVSHMKEEEIITKYGELLSLAIDDFFNKKIQKIDKDDCAKGFQKKIWLKEMSELQKQLKIHFKKYGIFIRKENL